MPMKATICMKMQQLMGNLKKLTEIVRH
jgi:hypothetical protein